MKIELEPKKNLCGKELQGTIIQIGNVVVMVVMDDYLERKLVLLKYVDGSDKFKISKVEGYFLDKFNSGKYVVLALPEEWKIVRDK